MLWDVANTLLEFLTIYVLFSAFAHLRLIHRHLWTYIPFAIGLSVFFCLNIPHFIILNIGLFILMQYVSFSSVPSRERILYACCSVFIVLTLELFFNTFLPLHLLHTFRGDTISNLIMVTVIAIYYYISMKTSIHIDVTAFMRRRYILVLICFIIWLALTQVYLQRMSELWSFIPGFISLTFFFIFIIGIILDIRYVRSEEHKQNVIYKDNLKSIEQYLQEIKIENHDYKHHIHHLQNMVRTASTIKDLQSNVDAYVAELDQSTALLETILAIDNTLFKALLYGAYMNCSRENIPFSFTTTGLLPSFPVKDYQMVAAVENLISNAVEANECLLKEEDRFVKIDIFADSSQNSITISNPVHEYSGNIRDYYMSGNTSKDPNIHYGVGLNSVLSSMSAHGVEFFGQYNELSQTITFTIRYMKTEVTS